MNFELVLNNLKNIYILIIDQNNNIVYPKDEKIKDKCINIYKNYLKDEDCYYHENKYYKLNEVMYYENNEQYKLISFQDITEYKIMEKKYKFDSLTTVLNRDTVLNKIDNYLLSTNEQFSIVMIDIDDFKKLNDTYGHIAGDLVLKHIGKLLNEQLKNYLVGRYGGEEFIILIQNSNKNESVDIMEEIRKKITKISIKHNNNIINNITISCGIYNIDYIYDKNDIEEIRDKFIDYADIALYRSKNNGKNQITVY